MERMAIDLVYPKRNGFRKKIKVVEGKIFAEKPKIKILTSQRHVPTV